MAVPVSWKLDVAEVGANIATITPKFSGVKVDLRCIT